MLELPVAAARLRQRPAVVFEKPDDLADLHIADRCSMTGRCEFSRIRQKERESPQPVTIRTVGYSAGAWGSADRSDLDADVGAEPRAVSRDGGQFEAAGEPEARSVSE